MKYHFLLIVIFSLHSFVHGQTLVAPNDQCEVTLKQSLQNAFIEAGGLQVQIRILGINVQFLKKSMPSDMDALCQCFRYRVQKKALAEK